MESSESEAARLALPAAGIAFRDLRHFKFPESLQSAAALERVGFTAAAAEQIFGRFSRSDLSHDPVGVIEFIFGHIGLLNGRDVRDMEPNAAMNLVGINKKIQNAILDPEHEQVYVWNCRRAKDHPQQTRKVRKCRAFDWPRLQELSDAAHACQAEKGSGEHQWRLAHVQRIPKS
jgi:hypothetical protein